MFLSRVHVLLMQMQQNLKIFIIGKLERFFMEFISVRDLDTFIKIFILL